MISPSVFRDSCIYFFARETEEQNIPTGNIVNNTVDHDPAALAGVVFRNWQLIPRISTRKKITVQLSWRNGGGEKPSFASMFSVWLPIGQSVAVDRLYSKIAVRLI